MTRYTDFMKKHKIISITLLCMLIPTLCFARTKTPAKDITANTSAFNGSLSPADDTVQKALDTLDDVSGGGGSGNVVGPASAVDNAITRYDGTTGKLIQDYPSNAPTISDTGIMTVDGSVMRSPATKTVTSSTNDIASNSADKAPDGTTDDVEINAAIAEVVAGSATGATQIGAGGKGVVELFQGNYNLDASLNPEPGITLKGQGSGSTVIKADLALNAPILCFDETTENPSAGFIMQGIYFDGNQDGGTKTNTGLLDTMCGTGTVPMWDSISMFNYAFNFANTVYDVKEAFGFRHILGQIEDSNGKGIYLGTNGSKVNGSIIAFSKIIQNATAITYDNVDANITFGNELNTDLNANYAIDHIASDYNINIANVTYGDGTGTSTVAGLPVSPVTNYMVTVSDGASSTDCTIGGGAIANPCYYNGSAWIDQVTGTGTGGYNFDATSDYNINLGNVVAGIKGVGYTVASGATGNKIAFSHCDNIATGGNCISDSGTRTSIFEVTASSGIITSKIHEPFSWNPSNRSVDFTLNSANVNDLFTVVGVIDQVRLGGAGGSNYAYFGNGGDLQFTGNADYIVADSAYAFRSASSPNVGMWFDSTNGALNIKDVSGTDAIRLGIDGKIETVGELFLNETVNTLAEDINITIKATDAMTTGTNGHEALTLKNSNFTMTDAWFSEADTYASFTYDNSSGGLEAFGYANQATGVSLISIASVLDSTKTRSSSAGVQLASTLAQASDPGFTGVTANSNLLSINDGTGRAFIFDTGGMYIIPSSGSQTVIRNDGASFVNGGFFGVGTSSPTSLIHALVTSGTAVIKAESTDANAAIIAVYAGGDVGGIRTGSNDPLVLGANSTEWMRINTAGEVGINKTATAGIELDVNGDIAASGTATITGAISTGGALSLSNGETISNSVDEVISLSNGTSAIKLSIGLESTGNDNVQLGVGVASATDSGYVSLMEYADMGNANRSPTSTSANPVFRVYSSDATQANDYIEMYHDQSNPVIDWGNGTLQLDGSNGVDLPNTTFANQDGIIYKNGNRFIHDFNYGDNGTVTTDGNNIFIGANSGNFTMGSTATQTYHSSNNVAQGANALLSNTTGYSNVAQGTSSLSSNTVGSNNSAQGAFSLSSNTVGSNNSAQGAFSLSSNTTGSSNSAQGSNALRLNTTGESNAAQGANAGRYIANGSTGNTTSDNSIYLGRDTKALADNDQNEIVIGYNATGAGSNTVTLGNDSIVDTLLKGNVGIGEPTPASTLEITSAGTTDLQIMSSGSSLGGRIILEDTDGAGCTSITALNGVLTAAIVTCP